MRIMGIDPGLSHTGWAVIESLRGRTARLVASGDVPTEPKAPLSDRLASLFRAMDGVFREYRPDQAGVEAQMYTTASGSNVPAYLATGVVYLLCGLHGVPLSEFSPKSVKSAVAGFGSADKSQMRRMVQVHLSLSEPIRSEHANDAVAIALCCFHSAAGLERLCARAASPRGG